MKLALALSLSVLFFTSAAFSQDGLGFEKNDKVESILTRQVGKGVQLILDSGEKVGGKVDSVGEHLVHLTGLVGQEFYEAAIPLDDISAVIVRAKTN
jgi:hypothetical protein